MSKPHNLDFLKNTFVDLRATSTLDIVGFYSMVEDLGYEFDQTYSYIQGEHHYLGYSPKTGFGVWCINDTIDAEIMDLDLYVVLIHMVNMNKSKISAEMHARVLVHYIKEKQDEGLPFIELLEKKK